MGINIENSPVIDRAFRGGFDLAFKGKYCACFTSDPGGGIVIINYKCPACGQLIDFHIKGFSSNVVCRCKELIHVGIILNIEGVSFKKGSGFAQETRDPD